MKQSLIKIIDTSKLSTIQSLNPIISQYLEKRDEAESVTYDFPWDLTSNKAYADFNLAVAVGLSRIHDQWLTIGELLEMPYGFDIARVEHNGKYYYDFNGPDGAHAGLRDALCVDKWWDQDNDIIYDEESGKWMQRMERYAA